MSRPLSVWVLSADPAIGDGLATTLTQAGYAPLRITHITQLEPDAARMRAPGEALTGRGAGYLRRLTDEQPLAVVVDLADEDLPWRDWIAVQKSSPATRRIAAIGVIRNREAVLAGLGFDRFITAAALSELPAALGEVGRHIDHRALALACAEPLSALGRDGIATFNRGDYFEAHEVLEHAWNADAGPARELYRGLLQIAVAYLQIERGNYNGALKMFLRMRQWLDPLPADCRGVDVAAARRAALAAQAALEALGPARIADFDRTLFKPILIRDDLHP
jgi:hypothetical protein